ncbi:hypothetical protein HY991_04065 [Candidatus Micrarchaeota archaeon]|nr:hypothetical protein [Candidatus Micrarchaeota archaeon]
MEENSGDAYKKRLLELQKAREAELQVKALLKQILTPEAYERVMNIRISNSEMYQQLASLLIYLAQQGQLNEKITEEKLKLFISKIVSKRRDTNIKLVHK